MKTLVMLVAATTLAVGCKKKATPPPATPSTGSATTMGGGSAMAGSAAPKPLTADDLVKRFHDCLADWTGARWDELRTCYTTDAVWEAPGSKLGSVTGAAAIVELDKTFRTAFPDENVQSQLVLVNGARIVAVALHTGKQTGPLKLPDHDLAPTGARFGVYEGQVLTVDNGGKISHASMFEDLATVFGQLAPKQDHPVRAATEKLAMPEQIAIAKDDAHEQANLQTFKQLVDAFDKHDIKAFGALLADKSIWSEQAMPKDQTKKELATNLPAMWKAFSDLELTVTDSWAAGDYVAATESFDGTNDGDLPMMHLKKTGKKMSLPLLAIHKVENGKVTATWIFYQGADFARELGLDTKISKN